MEKALKVAVVMGSDSDLGVMKDCIETLKRFNVRYEARIISAHRTPREIANFVSAAEENNVAVIIAAAGKAAHLAGVIASYTTLPVIAVPIKSSTLDGLDALLSMVQMPKGVPVATVAIDGAANAALLAIQVLAVSDKNLSLALKQYKQEMADEVARKDERLQKELLGE